MPIYVGGEVSGTSGSFVLGSEQNIFGDGTDTRSSAEALRDAYAVANTAWLAEYDANSSLNILLLYIDDSGNTAAAYQIRSGGDWRDNTSAIGIVGPSGSEGINYDKIEPINAKVDLPSAIGGVITLEDDTLYVLGNDITLGTDRLVFGSNTTLEGLESLVISLSYTGTDPLFTCTDVANRISKLKISCPNAGLFDWSDTTGAELRMSDIQSTCNNLGSFNGTQSLIRMSNTTHTLSGGMSFSGTWASFLYETSGITLNNGTMFDLGNATFLSILITQTLTGSAAGTTYLSGLADSGNIQVGGEGRIISTQHYGAGDVLDGVTSDDALWEFGFNDSIPNTRPDSLLSLQDNLLETTIAGTGVPVITNAIWVSERRSQFTNLVSGRTTYNGGKSATVPITLKASISPVNGQNKVMGVYVAINGVAITSSRATALTNSGDPTSITVVWQEQLNPDDYVEMWVSNETDTTDVLVANGVVRIN